MNTNESSSTPISGDDVLSADVTLNIDAGMSTEALRSLLDKLHVDVIVHCDDPDFSTLVPHVNIKVANADDAMAASSASSSESCSASASSAFAASPNGGQPELPQSQSSSEANMTPHRAIISMDSTLPDAERLFRTAIATVDAVAGNQVEGISPLYHVSRFDGPDAMSAVMQIVTAMQPRELIAMLQSIEHVNEDAIDLDVVDFEGVTSNDEDCRIPWPSAREHAGVLAPWMDMDPEARLGGDPVSFLLAMAPDAGRVGILSDNWIIGETL